MKEEEWEGVVLGELAFSVYDFNLKTSYLSCIVTVIASTTGYSRNRCSRRFCQSSETWLTSKEVGVGCRVCVRPCFKKKKILPNTKCKHHGHIDINNGVMSRNTNMTKIRIGYLNGKAQTYQFVITSGRKAMHNS